MSGSNNRSTSTPALLSKPSQAVGKALTDSAESKMNQAVLTKDAPTQYRVDASLKESSAAVAKTVVINEAFRSLCKQGYVVSLTCDSNAPGRANYYFDFNTERGKERISVGVTMDNDRAAYLVKKVLHGIQGN